MTVNNNLPPLPSQYLYGDRPNNTTSLPNSTNSSSSVFSSLIQMMEKYGTALLADLQATPTDPDAIASDLSNLQNIYDNLLSTTGGSFTATTTALLKLMTDIGNKQYPAAISDLANLSSSMQVPIDVAKLQDDFAQLAKDSTAASPDSATIQSDIDAINAQIKTLQGETSSYGANMQSDLNKLATIYMYVIEQFNSVQDWGDMANMVNIIIDGSSDPSGTLPGIEKDL